jgi:formylglycine-generating enzyme required for sulfatase activity
VRVEVVALAATVLLAGCGLFPSLEPLGACVEGCPGGAAAAGGAGTGGAGATSSGGGAIAGGAGGGGAAGDACAPPGDLGRPGVLVTPLGDKPAFCIDPYEVSLAELEAATFEHYTTVQALEALVGPDCDGNWDGRAPFESQQLADMRDAGMWSDRPAVGADWCEARAYCLWAGKDLCGDVFGGAEPGEPDNISQWFVACSENGTRTYSFGESLGRGTCHDPTSPTACTAYQSLLDVHASTCPGGFEGLFNMSGNAWEWTRVCTIEDGDDGCVVRGGGCDSDIRCETKMDRSRNHTDTDIAFRCCWSPAQ